MIAVTFALPAESADFIRLLGKRSRSMRGGTALIIGYRGGKEVGVLHTGVGEKAARESLRSVFAQRPLPQMLISAGFAGALDEQLQAGEVLLGQNYSDSELLPRAQRALANTRHKSGRLVSANAVLDSASDRRTLAASSGAIAVDMETQCIFEACRGAGVPMLSLRAITDTPALPFPVPPAILFDFEKQRTNFTALALHLARNPGAVARLLKFSRRVAAARHALTNALDVLLRASVD